MLSAVRLLFVCLSVCCLSVTLVHPTIAQGLYFLVPKIVGGGRPFPPEIFIQSDRPPFQTAQFRPISAHSASIVIASEKSSILTYRKSTTRFPTSHRWTVYVTPKFPKGWHKNAISRYRVKTSSGKVVATWFPYPTVHRSIAGDVPIYLKLAFKVTHPFTKRRFRKISLHRALTVTDITDTFCDKNLTQRI